MAVTTERDNLTIIKAAGSKPLSRQMSHEEKAHLQSLSSHIAVKEISYQAELMALNQAISDNTQMTAIKWQALNLLSEAYKLLDFYSYFYQHPKKRQQFYLDVIYLRSIAGTISNEEFARLTAPKASSSFAYIHEMKRTTFIREMTAKINWYRLFFLIRLKRFFNAIGGIEQVSHGYKSFVSAIDKAGPALSYLGWIFYLPRFITNVCLLLKHTIAIEMSEDEKSIAWQNRLKNELSKRWYELANDGIWLSVGLINCFLLTGHAALFLTVGLYLFDVFTAIGQSVHKLHQYRQAITDIELKKTKLSKDSPNYNNEQQALELQKAALISFRQHEIKKIKVNISVATGLFICMGLTALAIALPTGIGVGVVIAAALATLLVCLVQKHMQKKLAQEAPSKQASAIRAHGLFKEKCAVEPARNEAFESPLKAASHKQPVRVATTCREEVSRSMDFFGTPAVIHA